MRWWRAISGVFSRRAGGETLWSGNGWQASLFHGRGTQAGANVTAATAGGIPAIHRASSYISDALAAPSMRIVQVAADGGKETVTDSDAARALADWSFADKETFLFWACLGGNGFAVVRRNSRGGITRLESVAPRRVTGIKDEANNLFFVIESAEAPGYCQPEIVSAEAVAHLKYRNIGDDLGCTVFGTPPIVSCADAVGMQLKARDYMAALWKYGATPVGFLKTPGFLKAPVIERLKQQWNEQYAWGNFTGRTAILEAGLEWHPIKPGVMGSDADLVNHGKFSVEEVGRMYGLPPSVLGQTGSASYSTAVEEFRAAVLHALRPWAERFADCLGRALLTRDQRMKGMRVELSLDHLLVAPGKEMSEYLRELLNAGVLSINEGRNMLGLPDVDGGEVRRAPVNTTAIQNLPFIGLPKPKDETP